MRESLSIAIAGRTASLVVAGALCALPAWAGEFQLNSYTTGGQALPRIGMRPNGDFVVSWLGPRIEARLFAADGTPLGPDFEVNNDPASLGEGEPSVARSPAGEFVVVWRSRQENSPPAPPLDAIRGRRYAADGTALGSEFEISPAGYGKRIPSVGMDAGGGFAVGWQAYATGVFDRDVFARRYAQDGTPVGPEFQVNQYTTNDQAAQHVAMGAGGEFVVVWNSEGSLGNDVFSSSVQARLYDAGGIPQGSQFQVNTYTVGGQGLPDVAKGMGGSFVVVWYSSEAAGETDLSVWGRRYAQDGTPLSGEFALNTYTTGEQVGAAVAVAGTGEFLSVWESDWTGSGNSEIRMRRFRSDGTPFGPDFQVNSYTTGGQAGAAVAGDALGNFVVVWGSVGSAGTDTSGTSVQGAREVSELQVTNDDGVTTAVPGGMLTYTITASHVTGLQAVVNATVLDWFAPELGCTWTCAGAGGGTCTQGPVSGPINDPVVLPVGSSVTYAAGCAISPTATGSIVTTATVTGSSPGLFDSEPSNNTATDVDVLQGLVIDDVSQGEGNGGSTAFGFTVTLASPLPSPVTVDYGTADGTATVADNDYVPVSGTLTFAPGETSKAVPVSVVGDTVFEADETFLVTLSNAVGSAIVDGAGVGTILNDDSAVPSGSVDELVHGSVGTRSLETLPGPVAIAQEWGLRQAPYASYEVLVDGVTGDLGPDGPALDRLGSDGSVVQSAVGATGGSARSLRFENRGVAVVDQRIRVQSRGCITTCDASDTFRIGMLETTLRGSRFNNSATQVTLLVVQNASESSVAGHTDFWGASGVLLHSEPFLLLSRQTLVLNTSTVGALQGQAGSLTVSNDGRYGALVGKAVAVEPATGFTFDTALEARRR